MQWLARCLISCIGYDVIVVDNASTDKTITFIKENFPDVKLIKQNSNLGFGQANNIGLSIALKEDVDYIFLLNQDAYLQPHTISTLIEVHKSNKDFGVISPIHLNGDGSNLDKNFSSYIKVSDALFFDSLKGKYNDDIYEVPFVNAAAWLLPSKTLETIGGFDPIFYHYGEDDNYCQRVLFHSLKIGIVPSTYIFHDREDRIDKVSLTFEENLVLKERQLKHRWANINKDVDTEIKNYTNRLKKTLIKVCIKLKFKKASNCLRELTLIKKLLPEIFLSRKTNIKIGRNYL
jgi:GT2 family glycosyltransferase